MLPIRIKGTGIYAPGEAISNEELKKLAGIDFDAEKTETKLGIYRRHIARLRGLPESTADFATRAAENALAQAGIQATEVGLIIVATDTPEYISPSTAILVQGRLQGEEQWTASFDVNASCASFTIALDMAAHQLNSRNDLRYALVIGVYNMPAFVRPDDAFGWSIFADGAGAFVLEKMDNTSGGYLGGVQLTDGTQWDFIGIYAGGSRNQITHEMLERGQYGLQNLKPLPGDRNVRLWPMIAQSIFEKYGMKASDIDHFLFTQINRSVIEKVMVELGEPMTKTTCIMQDYGYTGSGCIPMAFHIAVQQGKIKRGHRVMMIASGAGLAVGGNVLIY
ncbi:MAG: ketoacyl-ACP synthase III [Bacteroidales bacterium]|nr:ketoacyl-ACP synthase III [Bacteroidales bacterium]